MLKLKVNVEEHIFFKNFRSDIFLGGSWHNQFQTVSLLMAFLLNYCDKVPGSSTYKRTDEMSLQYYEHTNKIVLEQ